MVHFFQYSLESAICLVVLLLPYLVWFKKTTFHQWNRFYLLGAILFSLSAPLVNIQIATETNPMPDLTKNLYFFEEMPQVKGQVQVEEPILSESITVYKQPDLLENPGLKQATSQWDWAVVSLIVYVTGLLVFGSLFLFRLAKLFRLIRKAEKHRGDGLVRVHLSGKQVFSFFSYIFLDKHRYKENERGTLLHHEQVHIQQWHSLDVLALEILQVVFWFNPLYRIYRKLLQQEHEYFVDATTSKEIGQPQYAQMLLSLATSKRPVLGHAFAYIPVKHRIFKLFQKPSTTMEKSRFLIALPIVLSLFLVFSCSVEELNISSISEVTPYTDKRVSGIKTFFKDNRSSIGQENEAITIHLNEDGTIADTEIKEYPVFTEDLPEYDWSEVYSLFEKSPITNFLLDNVQWLVGEDADIKPICLKAILYSSNGTVLKNLEKQVLTDDRKLNVSESSNIKNQGFKIFGKGFKVKESSDENYKVFQKLDGLAYRGINLNDFGKISQLVEMFKSVNTWHRKDKDLTKVQNNIPKNGIFAHERTAKLNVKYGRDGLISEMKYDFTYEMDYDGKRDTHEKYTYTFHFTNDENGRVKALEILDNEGISLRKYRFHYNEAGYCTKKECINREGSVEFSVRFEYEFFD